MKRPSPARLLGLLALAAASRVSTTLAQSAGITPGEQALRDTLRSGLSFFASFDHGPNADYARGDRLIYSAPTYKDIDFAVADLPNGDIDIAKGQGRFGDALEFRKKNTQAVFYRAAVNVPYRTRNWSGTISFWLSLTPDVDLEPGYTDPLQVTDKAFNNAALWVDFTRDDKPRHFRLGVFGDSAAWNRQNLPADQNPFFNDRTIVVTQPPFTRGQWTHVAIVFDRLNSDSGGTAKLYLNGQLAGTKSGIHERFSWEPEIATIRLGTNYVGLMDELSMYDRPLSEAAIGALYHLSGGVATLIK
jgi:concanavalin A-like lectin/glucanase superfamily protein